MRHICIDKRFVNEKGDGLIPSKIHTIRANYSFWKKYEGKEVALFTWDGKPRQKGSKQKVFCTKKIKSVQEVLLHPRCSNWRWTLADYTPIHGLFLSTNDGFFLFSDFADWFEKYKPGKMAVLHFTDYRYQGEAT